MKSHIAFRALDCLYRGNRLQVRGRTYAMAEDGEIILVAQSNKSGEVFLTTSFLVSEWYQLIDGLDGKDKVDLVFQLGHANYMAK